MFASLLTFNPRSKATNIGPGFSLVADFGYWSKVEVIGGEFEEEDRKD